MLVCAVIFICSICLAIAFGRDWMKVNVYYKNGNKKEFQQVKKTETTKQEIILHIEKHINRYAIKQLDVIEQYMYGEEIHKIEGKE